MDLRVILSLVGLAAAVWAWDRVHPAVGLVVGFLFVGGTGWYWVVGWISLLRPSVRNRLRQRRENFAVAWTARFGGEVPAGVFEAWLTDHTRTGVPADVWLHTRFRR